MKIDDEFKKGLEEMIDRYDETFKGLAKRGKIMKSFTALEDILNYIQSKNMQLVLKVVKDNIKDNNDFSEIRIEENEMGHILSVTMLGVPYIGSWELYRNLVS